MEAITNSTVENFQNTNQINQRDIYQLLEDIQDVCSTSSSDESPSEPPAWTHESLYQANFTPHHNYFGSPPSICKEQTSVENRHIQLCPNSFGPHYNSSYHSYPVSQRFPQPIVTSVQSKVQHRAEISLVQTSRTQFKAIIKRKRKRTMFTTEQLQSLEEVFKTKPYIIRKDREELADRLQLSDKSVKVWFQNRRLKGKRRPSTESNESLLDYVETQIHEKTDQFGYVTLDDQVMGDLLNVVDNLLSNTVEASPDDVSVNTNFDSSPVYEPISPASVTEDEDTSFIQHQPYQYVYCNSEYMK